MRSAARSRRFATVCRTTIVRRSTGCRPPARSSRVWFSVARAARRQLHSARDVAAAEEQLQQAERDVSARSAVYRAQSRPVTIDAVQSRVAAGAALVEIAIYRPFNNRVAQRDKRFGAARYVAYVVRTGAEPASVDLGDVSAIDAQVESLRRALSNPKSAGSDVPRQPPCMEVVVRPLLPLLGERAKTIHLA